MVRLVKLPIVVGNALVSELLERVRWVSALTLSISNGIEPLIFQSEVLRPGISSFVTLLAPFTVSIVMPGQSDMRPVQWRRGWRAFRSLF